MALEVEDGTGKSNADAYLSVTEADTYFTSRGMPKEWHESQIAAKEEAIRVATTYLDTAYGYRWQGIATKETQALHWPRYGVSSYGYVVDSDIVPVAIKRATAEVALRHIKDKVILFPDVATSERAVLSESVSVGPISESKTYAGGKESQASFPFIDGLLSSYLTDRFPIERG